jgi:repressor LexA
MAKLSDRDYLGRLRDFYARNQYIPSLRDCADIFGFRAHTAARALLERLERDGALRRSPDGKAWLPDTAFFALPLLDAPVRAGTPENVDIHGASAQVDLSAFVVRNPSKTVCMRVRGESMCDAGIHDGDLAVVELNAQAVPGDFVYAFVDREFTLKELALEEGRYVLKPHNPDFPIIRPAQALEIFGVLTGIVRRYQH